jgi:hypothetical protein
VGRPRLAVEKPATTEVPCCLHAIDGQAEPPLPQPLRGRTREQLSQALSFSLSPLNVFRAWLDEPATHVQLFNTESDGLDGNQGAARQSLAAFKLHGQGQRERTCWPLEVDA